MKKFSLATIALAAALAVTPEPASLFLLGTGLLGLALVFSRSSVKRTAGMLAAAQPAEPVASAVPNRAMGLENQSSDIR